jgi:phosphotransferase system enzyme I (PtsI)
MLKGIGVSAGIAIGKVLLLTSSSFSVVKSKISKKDVPREIDRFKKALDAVIKEITKTQNMVKEKIDKEHSHILDAHLMILQDVLLSEETIKKIKEERWNVEYAFLQVIESISGSFASIDAPYLKERINDIRNIGDRVLDNLLDREKIKLSELKEKLIVISHDLSPTDTAQMNKEKVMGFATDIGSRTSHTAIMARALDIPAVVGLKNVTSEVKNGDILILDGYRGTVIINPAENIIEKYKQRRTRLIIKQRSLSRLKDLPAETLDGYRVKLMANIELPEELPSVIAHGAEGIGLYRTEFFYFNRDKMPSEEEQFNAYKTVAEKIAPFPIIIRTLDLGGDKFISQPDISAEANPFLGCRAIRFCLEQPKIFETQLRAILRASIYGKIKLMFPLISCMDEIIAAKKILLKVKGELKKKNIPFDESTEVGVMIETPAAVMICDFLAKETTFFSIGTNDLIQYSLAVDRVNERIAYLYDPVHPAVLRLLKIITEGGHRNGVEVNMCGEMSGDPLYAPILVGMGIDEFSMSAAAIPAVKKVIRALTFKECKDISERILHFRVGQDVRKYIKKRLNKVFVKEMLEYN